MKAVNINEVCLFIDNHPESSAKDIACHFGYSYYHFSRAFKKQMGVSLREHLAAKKVERGLQSLSEPRQKYTVTDAQLDAGYETLGAFSESFKKFTGYSPKNHKHKILSFVQELNQRLNGFHSPILYQPFEPTQHQHTHGLKIKVHNRQQPNSLIFVALYPSALPKDIPALGICMRYQTHYTVQHIPEGTYYAMVVEIILSPLQPIKILNLNNFYRDICREPITFPLSEHRIVNLNLRAKNPQDPPINIHPIKLLFDVLHKKN